MKYNILKTSIPAPDMPDRICIQALEKLGSTALFRLPHTLQINNMQSIRWRVNIKIQPQQYDAKIQIILNPNVHCSNSKFLKSFQLAKYTVEQ